MSIEPDLTETFKALKSGLRAPDASTIANEAARRRRHRRVLNVGIIAFGLAVVGFGIFALVNDSTTDLATRPLDTGDTSPPMQPVFEIDETELPTPSLSGREANGFFESLKSGRWKLIEASPGFPDGSILDQGIYFVTKTEPSDRIGFYGASCHASWVALRWEEPGLAEVVRDESSAGIRNPMRRCGDEPAPGISNSPPRIGSSLQVDVDEDIMEVQLIDSTGTVEWQARFEYDEYHLIDGLTFTSYDEGRAILLEALETAGWRNEGGDHSIAVGDPLDLSVHSLDGVTVTIITEWQKLRPSGNFGEPADFADLPGALSFSEAGLERIWFTCRDLSILTTGEPETTSAVSNAIWDYLACTSSVEEGPDTKTSVPGQDPSVDFMVGSTECLPEQDWAIEQEIILSIGDGEAAQYDPTAIQFLVPAGSSLTVNGDGGPPVGDLDGDGSLDTVQFIDVYSPNGNHLAEGIRICGTSRPLNSFFVPSSSGNFGALVVPFPGSAAGIVNRGPTTGLSPEDVWLFDSNGDLLPPYARGS